MEAADSTIAKEAEKLSQHVQKMAKQTEEIIEETQFESKTVSSLMESGCEKLLDSLSLMKTAKSVYKEIAASVDKVAAEMQDLQN